MTTILLIGLHQRAHTLAIHHFYSSIMPNPRFLIVSFLAVSIAAVAMFGWYLEQRQNALFSSYDGTNKNVLVIGETGAGKSHFCNVITNSNDFLVGHSLDSCTNSIMTVNSSLFGDTSMPVTVSDTGGLSVSALHAWRLK